MICARNQVDKKKYGASLAQKPGFSFLKPLNPQKTSWGQQGGIWQGKPFFVNSAPGCPQKLSSI